MLQPRPSTITTRLDPADLLEADPRILLLRLLTHHPLFTP
jgi:hypothetical protein